MDGKIYEAISNVMKDVGVVGKGDSNDYDHYKYRGIDAVMNALNPAMIKNRVFVTPTVLESTREERAGKSGGSMVYSVLTVKYTFFTTDGSSVECVVIGEAMDRSDKSTNKAMSAAFKYACFQTFCIPTEEMIDSESESPEILPKKKETKTTKAKQDSPEEAKLNEEMIASVDPKCIPNPNRSKDDMKANIEEEMKRTGINEKSTLATMGIKDWDEITDVKYIAIMEKFKRQPTKESK